MTLNSAAKAAFVGMIPLATLALLIRYAGNQPFISDIKEGLKGNVKA